MVPKRVNGESNKIHEDLGRMSAQIESINENLRLTRNGLDAFQTTVQLFMQATLADRATTHEQVDNVKKGLSDHISGHIRFSAWLIGAVSAAVAIVELTLNLIKWH